MFQTVMVTVRPGCDMYRRGSAAPALSVQIWSVGVFDEERNPGYTRRLYDFLMSTTKLPPERSVHVRP